MALDYSNERYIRLYTRDTATWKLIDWRARTVLLHLLRKVDRAGVLDVGSDGELGLAAVLELPEEIVSAGVVQLVKRGTVQTTATAYVLPNFLEAQEAKASDKARQRKLREDRRARAMADNVTPRDDESRHVTERHEQSQGVTGCHSEPSRAEPRQDEPEREERPTTSAPIPQLALVHTSADPGKSDPVADLWAEQNRLRAETIPRSQPLTLTVDRRKAVAGLLKSGHTVEALMACLRVYADEARRGESRWFDGVSNWRPENVTRALGKVGTESRERSPPPRGYPPQPPPHQPRRTIA